MIKAIIVEDEPLSADALASLLRTWCPLVKVEGICHSVADAVEKIQIVRPDLVFLDIEMPHRNGFELLEMLPEKDFNVIFTTSYNQYAIQAFRVSALDYLLKPIDRNELMAAVNKTVARKPSNVSLDLLVEQLRQPNLQRIALPTFEGLQLVAAQEILACIASSNYTLLHLKNGQTLTISRTLKEFEEMLEGAGFLRIHHSNLVQINEISQYIRGEGGSVKMSNGLHLDVSKSRKEELLRRLTQRRK